MVKTIIALYKTIYQSLDIAFNEQVPKIYPANKVKLHLVLMQYPKFKKRNSTKFIVMKKLSIKAFKKAQLPKLAELNIFGSLILCSEVEKIIEDKIGSTDQNEIQQGFVIMDMYYHSPGFQCEP